VSDDLGDFGVAVSGLSNLGHVLVADEGFVEGFAGRVAPGDCSPGAPTDPGGVFVRTQLVISCRYAAK
jgi:hypothetical protein